MTPSEKLSDAPAPRLTDFIRCIARIRYPRLVRFNIATANMFNYTESSVSCHTSFDVASLLTSFRTSWGLSTRYGLGANEYHECQFRTTKTLRPFLVIVLMPNGSLLDSLEKTRQVNYTSRLRIWLLTAFELWTANTVDVLSRFSSGTLH
ncbi:hypothetical protein EV424DRAFT_1349139 [Suillus variegatus]|nr:hypothetical protein EV424DRAFT_1349139 [Suillus variegatus]